MSDRRFSRRRFLGGTAVAGGAAAAAGLALALSRDDKSRAPTVQPSTSATIGGAPTPSPPPAPKGGIARISAFQRFNFDTFDAQKTGEPSVLEVLGRTHSRLVDWVNFAEPAIGAGLAERWEQPDPATLILRLDPGARWQESSAFASRPVTASDVVQHFRRALQLSAGRLPLAQRSEDYARWEAITASDDTTVRITTKEPDPFLLATLASRFALVHAPEAVAAFSAHWEKLRPDSVAGSGPFHFDGQRADGALTFSAVRGGHFEANLDGIVVFEPGRAEDLLAFKRDEFLARDRRDTVALREETRLRETARYEDRPIVSTFFIGAPPWNNPDLVRALSAALNRGWLSDQLFGGRADACGPVSPASGSFALDAASLARYPGYGADSDADAATARALWEAAGGPGLGTITIDFPSIFDPLYSASSVVTGRLNRVLGQQFRAAVETYTTISTKTAEKRYGNGRAAFWFGWGPPLLEPDPSRELIATFSSTGPNAALLGLKLGPIDDALAAVASTRASAELRAARVREAQAAILEAGGRGIISWLLQRSELFRWPYWNGSPATPFWTQQLEPMGYFEPNTEPFASRPP